MGLAVWMGCYHWAPQSDLFAGLPAGGWFKKTLFQGIPSRSCLKWAVKFWAGSLRNTQSRLEAPAMLWYSDLEVVRLGKGPFSSASTGF